MKTFSIIVPVFQNDKNLPKTIPTLLAFGGNLSGYRVELVLVDDGSTDRSRELIIEAIQQFPEKILGVLLTRNFGQTAAIQAGLRHANGDCAGIISCDLQEPHELFAKMLESWEQGAKFVIGERVARAETRSHQAASSIYWKIVRRFAFRDFPPIGYDFCLLDRQVINDINQINEKNSSIFVLIYWLGYRPVRVPIFRELRQAGRSQWNLRRKITFTINTLIGFTHVPARVITILGMGSSVLAVLYLLFLTFRWAQLRQAPPGWMTVVGLVTLLGALNLFALGILSEYLLRILDESRKRPPFVVDAVLSSASASPKK